MSLSPASFIARASGTLRSCLQPWAVVSDGSHWYCTRALPRATFAQLAGVLLLAAPFALYYGWQSMSNSAYAAWNRQNITPSFPPLDYTLAGGSVLLLAGLYLWREFRRNWL